jgi:acyl carrier protein
MDELVEQLKTDIIYALDLAEVAPADFNGDTPLFDEGVGLNSIDALEIVVLLERKYALKIEDLKNRRTVLYSIRSIAEYITSSSPPVNRAVSLRHPTNFRVPNRTRKSRGSQIPYCENP